MGRIRTIKPELPQSESLGRVSREARLCFILLFTVADDEGRLRGNPQMLAGILYPYDRDAVELLDKWLNELEKQHCIVRYEVESKLYIQICNWHVHQKIEHKFKSKFPPGSVSVQHNYSSPTVDIQEVYSSHTEDIQGGSRIKDHRPGTKDQGIASNEAVSTEPEKAPARVAAAADDLPVITLPLNDNSEYPIAASRIAHWAELFPAVDVPQQLRHMQAWCEANPKKRKTHNGILHFIASWLSKEQNRGISDGNSRRARADILTQIRNSQREPDFGYDSLSADKPVER